MEIKVGDYVRTNLGNIGKIVEEYTFKNNKAIYPEPQELVLDNGYVLNEAMMFETDEEIVKHSKKIIDLIEVGDYVNGYRVQDKYKSFDKKYLLDLDGEFTNSHCLEEIEIKSIVTKQQFSSLEYII